MIPPARFRGVRSRPAPAPPPNMAAQVWRTVQETAAQVHPKNHLVLMLESDHSDQFTFFHLDACCLLVRHNLGLQSWRLALLVCVDTSQFIDTSVLVLRSNKQKAPPSKFAIEA